MQITAQVPGTVVAILADDADRVKKLSANYFDNFERSLRGCFLSRSGSAGVIA